MDSFEEWFDKEHPGVSPRVMIAEELREAYIAGLRRAAEIAREYPGVYGNSPTAEAIEREARKVEGE